MSIAALENEMVRITKDFREKMAAFDVTNMELRNLEAKIEALKAAEKAKPPRNWPERIEAGMQVADCMICGIHPYSFRSGEWARLAGVVMVTPKDAEPRLAYVAIFDDGVVDYIAVSDGMNISIKARDILTIRTDAHEPTGAVVVAEPTPDEWREIAAKAISADLADFLSGAAAYGLWLRGKIPQAIPADRVMADGMVGVDREAIKTAIGLVRCLVVGPGSGQDALSAMESALRTRVYRGGDRF